MSTQVTLTGRLVRDPELKFSKTGKPIATFSVVTSRRFKNPDTNEWEDRDTTFWDCAAFGQLAENVTESLVKGAAVIVVGNASQDEWIARDGQKRRSMKVTCDEVAPSLRNASAQVKHVERSKPAASQQQSQDPWQADSGGFTSEPPF